MTKIYEALENAGRERAEDGVVSASLPAGCGQPLRPPPKSLEDKLLTVYRRIEMLLEGRRGRVVEFAGVHVGEDGSRILEAFAQFVATGLKKRVLLLTVGREHYGGRHFTGDAAQGWQRVLFDDAPVDDVVFPVGDTGMSVSLLAPTDAALTLFLDSPRLRDTIETLRGRFDMILIDPSPLGTSPDAALLSGIADGVVLVVEAEKTRWQVVKHVMDEINAQHGTVLGVILNKWHYYIPGFVYRMLP